MAKIVTLRNKANYSLNIENLLKRVLPDVEIISVKEEMDGFEVVKEENPDIFFIDTTSLQLSSSKIFDALKKDKRTEDIPVVIIVQGNGESKADGRDLKWPCDAVLSAPFNELELSPLVKSMIKIKELNIRYKEDREHKIITDRADNILEATNAGTWDWDIATNKMIINPRWAEMLGYSVEELQPVTIDTWRTKVHPKDLRTAKQKIARHFKKALKYYYAEFRLRHKNGNWVWINSRGKVVEWSDDGKPLRMAGTHIDITNRKSIEKELIKAKLKAEESRRYSNIITEISKEIISPELSIKKIADIVYFNALKLTNSKFGYVSSIDRETKSNVGQSFGEMMKVFCDVQNQQLVFPLNGDKYSTLWGYSLNTLKSVYSNDLPNYLLTNKLPETPSLLKNFLSVPVVAKNKLLGQIALANKTSAYNEKDLSIIQELANIYGLAIYRKEIEEDLRIAKTKAEESDRLKSAFLANMSHEIRTPMNGILGFIDLLKTQNLSTAQHNRYIDLVQKSGDRLLGTINDIIELSKIEAGETPLYPEALNINEVMQFLLDFFEHQAKKKGLTLSLSNSDPATQIKIKTDRNKLESILTNLIKNAIKFTEYGSIEFGYHLGERDLIFYVEDTGIGISADRQEAIFDRFVQANLSITRGHEGSGLGLSIARAYTKMLGGKLWVESEPGRGSTFYFTIKFEPILTQKKIVEKKNINRKRKRKKSEFVVLVAEDEPTSFELIGSILEMENYKLIHAADGKKAIELFIKNPDISLILMDIKMPVVDGIEATRQIRQMNKEIPIIAQTSYALPGDKEKALEAGCTDYIAKPLKTIQLLQKVEKYLLLEPENPLS